MALLGRGHGNDLVEDPTEGDGVMEGRWTIYGWSASGPFVLGKHAVPVVPCDDAAVERALAALSAMGYALPEARVIVTSVLRAAGETP